MAKRKTPYEVRSEAAEICDSWADERRRCGDEEGAEVMLEAALEIRRIVLTKASGEGDKA